MWPRTPNITTVNSFQYINSVTFMPITFLFALWQKTTKMGSKQHKISSLQVSDRFRILYQNKFKALKKKSFLRLRNYISFLKILFLLYAKYTKNHWIVLLFYLVLEFFYIPIFLNEFYLGLPW